MFNKRQYLKNAKLISFKDKVRYSKDLIHSVMDKIKNPYVAWSAGKDSTALMYIITQDCGYKDSLIFSEKDDCDFPDEKDYLLKLKQKYNLNLEIVEPKESMWEYLIKNKIDLQESIHKKQHEITKKFFIECIERFKSNHPEIDGYFMGLRNEESKYRLMNYAQRGEFYFKKSEQLWVCNPLSKWSATDIFSYLLINKVPILSVYLKASNIRLAENIRKSWWMPAGSNIRYGGITFLKMEYPELFIKLIKAFPELQQYS